MGSKVLLVSSLEKIEACKVAETKKKKKSETSKLIVIEPVPRRQSLLQKVGMSPRLRKKYLLYSLGLLQGTCWRKRKQTGYGPYFVYKDPRYTRSCASLSRPNNRDGRSDCWFYFHGGSSSYCCHCCCCSLCISGRICRRRSTISLLALLVLVVRTI